MLVHIPFSFSHEGPSLWAARWESWPFRLEASHGHFVLQPSVCIAWEVGLDCVASMRTRSHVWLMLQMMIVPTVPLWSDARTCCKTQRHRIESSFVCRTAKQSVSGLRNYDSCHLASLSLDFLVQQPRSMDYITKICEELRWLRWLCYKPRIKWTGTPSRPPKSWILLLVSRFSELEYQQVLPHFDLWMTSTETIPDIEGWRPVGSWLRLVPVGGVYRYSLTSKCHNHPALLPGLLRNYRQPQSSLFPWS